MNTSFQCTIHGVPTDKNYTNGKFIISRDSMREKAKWSVRDSKKTRKKVWMRFHTANEFSIINIGVYDGVKTEFHLLPFLLLTQSWSWFNIIPNSNKEWTVQKTMWEKVSILNWIISDNLQKKNCRLSMNSFSKCVFACITTQFVCKVNLFRFHIMSALYFASPASIKSAYIIPSSWFVSIESLWWNNF